MSFHLIFLFSALLISPVAFAQTPSYQWKVSHQWSEAYESKFSEFVSLLGQSGCKNIHSCLTSKKSNPFYYKKTPTEKRFLSDCADLPYVLRMYFAWMEGLSFDYVSAVAAAQPQSEPHRDLRYTKYGNKPQAYTNMKMGQTYNAYEEHLKLTWNISTATYRMHYNQISDFYPPSLNLQNIRPGTVLYDPAGHAAIVYKIEKDGRLRLIDAHPDQSITHITFDKKFARSKISHGAGFKNWRPELNFQPTEKLKGFSIEQFSKTFTISGMTVDYYEYVRSQMAGGHLNFYPVEELKNTMFELCENIQDRIHAVDAAIKAGMDKKPHPARLPDNIYGTVGEWEEYSSPSRDARLKVAFVSLYQDTLKFISEYNKKPNVIYEPVHSRYSHLCSTDDKTCFLKASLLETYEQVASHPACQMSYTSSSGQKRDLNYETIVQRLYSLSFDPYDCIELRWGAFGQELQACRNDAYKMRWHEAQQGLRNQLERNYDARMNYDVEGTRNLGVPTAPPVDLYLKLKEML